jgi:hypothetical protein
LRIKGIALTMEATVKISLPPDKTTTDSHQFFLVRRSLPRPDRRCVYGRALDPFP